MSDLEHRASRVTGEIMRNRLSDRFKQGDESAIDMMKRIQSEIITDAIADQGKQTGGVWRGFLVMTISRKAYLATEKIFDFSMEVRGVNPQPQKQKHCNQGKHV